MSEESPTNAPEAPTPPEVAPLLSGPPTGWDDFVESHPAGHILQTSGWAELKNRFGWWSRRLALPGADGRLRAGGLLLFRRVAGQVLAYVPKGPVVDWSDPGLAQATIAQLATAARQEGAFLLKVEPELLDTAANRRILLGAGLRPSPQTIQPRSTVVVDLRPDEDAILARMKSKWRYNIRLAARKGVSVRQLSADELPLFQQLMEETGARDGFSVHSPAYYRAAHELLVPRWGGFFLAEFEGEPLAGIAVFACGDTAWYLWGASSNRQRNLMPNHALQWAGMQWAKARGCTRYDFWGIPDEIGAIATGLWQEGQRPVPAEDVPVDVRAFPPGDLWGVFRFKQGFGGTVERSVGGWDLPLDWPRYGLYRGALLAKDRLAELRRSSPAGGESEKAPAVARAPARALALEPVATRAAWAEMCARLPGEPGHVLQSWEWGQVKAASGWQAERWAVRRGAQVLGGFQLLWRQPVAGLPLRVAYVPKGPLLDWQDEEAVSAVLAQIEGVARRRGCLQVKIDPDVLAETRPGRRVTAVLARRGWRFSPEQIQFKNTGFTDLDRSEEALLASFKSKWRYNIRLAQRRGIEVRQGGVDDLADFYALYAGTSQRDGFLIRPFAYYDRLWRTFLAAQANAEQADGQADGQTATGGALLLAQHPQESAPVAGIFLLRHGPQAVYFNGASSERRRRDMPNHLLQWRGMQWAQAQGCRVYDWWGAPTDPGNEADPLQGVWRFKEGFDAHLAVHIGAWDWSPLPLLWHGYQRGMPLLLGLMRRRHAGTNRHI